MTAQFVSCHCPVHKTQNTDIHSVLNVVIWRITIASGALARSTHSHYVNRIFFSFLSLPLSSLIREIERVVERWKTNFSISFHKATTSEMLFHSCCSFACLMLHAVRCSVLCHLPFRHVACRHIKCTNN